MSQNTFQNHKSKTKLAWTLALAAALTLFLVALGGYVRATGAGLSCPDWPWCYGRIIPHTLEGGIFQEVFHRFVAGLVSILSLGLLIYSIRQKAEFPKLFRFSLAIFLLLLCQVVLGGLTVILKVNPFIVTAHLAFGTLYFQIMSLAALELRTNSSVRGTHPNIHNKCDKSFVVFFIILTFVQILFGGFVGSSGASLACPDIPFCHGSLWPSGGSQRLHMVHRVIGVILLVGGILLFQRSRFQKECLGVRPRLCLGIVFLLCVQLLLGLTNVFLAIPVWLTVLHLIVAQLILLATALLLKDCTRFSLLSASA